jgi:DNA modification methylase
MGEVAKATVSGGTVVVIVRESLAYPVQNDKRPIIQLAGHKIQSALRKHKVELVDRIIWFVEDPDEQQELPATKYGEIYHAEYPFPIRHHSILIFRKQGDREHPSNEAAIQQRISEDEWQDWTTGIWRINHSEKGQQVLPDELVQRLVLMFSYNDDTVLDPYLGTGTTVKVARELGRKAVGYECDLKCKQVIMERLGMAPEVGDIDANIEQVRHHLGEDTAERQPKTTEAQVASPVAGRAVSTETGEIMAELHEALAPA